MARTLALERLVPVDAVVKRQEGVAVAGPSPGGFFSTHPGTTERIAALRNR